MSGDYEDDHDDGNCWQCGGEGFVFDCIDGQCLDCDVGCDLCTKNCDICNPAKPSKEREQLGQILADALAKARTEKP